jgi:hypothetical protein
MPPIHGTLSMGMVKMYCRGRGRESPTSVLIFESREVTKSVPLFMKYQGNIGRGTLIPVLFFRGREETKLLSVLRMYQEVLQFIALSIWE